MGGITSSVSDPFKHAFKDFFEKATDKVSDNERAMLVKLNEKILAATPVWMGDALLNWRWSTRSPDMSHEPARGGNTPPGPTNSMALGEEPRRPANESRPRRSLAAALRAKFPTNIYLTNTSPHAVALEYGLLPTPERSRVDGAKGIVRLAIAELEAGV